MKRTSFPMIAGVRWPMVLAGGLAAALAVGLYTFRITMPSDAGSAELHTLQQAGELDGLAANPLLLAYKLPAWLLLQIYGSSLLPARLAAVGVMLASLAAFYLLARRWYGRLNGAAAAVLFATSSWSLHTGRYAAGYGVLMLLVLVLLNLVVWTNNSERSRIVLPLFAAAMALSLFAPGGIWFAAATMVLCRGALVRHVRQAGLAVRAGSAVLPLAAVVLMGMTVMSHHDIARQFLGLPDSFPAPADLLKQAGLAVSAFVIRGPGTPEVWLGHTPILDVASLALLLLGVAFYSRFLTKPRTRLILVFAGIGLVLTALNGAPALNYLVPVVYLLLAGGLTYLMHQWKRIFPRNPIAQAVAVTLIGLLLAGVAAFQTQRYFQAWLHSAETAQAYGQASAGPPQAPYLIQ